MKSSKQAISCTLICDVKIVLPRVPSPQPKTLFKRKKTNYERISGSSDKENDSRKVIYSQPNLNLIQIEKVVEVDGKHEKKKAKKNKKCFRKDSGIYMESPKAKRTEKRKYSDVDCPSDNEPGTAIITSPVGEISGLENIIQSHSSHNCADKIDHEVNNAETIRTSNGLFVRRDFVIRIKQLCIDQPSENSTPERTTSVIASTSRCENIEKSSEKVRQNLAVDKKIGINTRVKIGDREKNCTRIVESKFVQTTEQIRKKIKLHEPSRMVTRRKAAVNAEYEFFTLTNTKDGTFVVTPNASKSQKSRQDQNKASGFNQQNELMCSSKKIFAKKKKHLENTNEKSEETDPKPSCSKSFSAKITRTVKNVSLCREQSIELFISSQRIQKVESYVDKKSVRSKRTIVQEIETKQLRKSSRIKKLLNDATNNKENAEPTIRTNAQQLNDRSAAKDNSHQRCDRISSSKKKRQNLEPLAKINSNKPSQQMKDGKIELPKKRSEVLVKKRIKDDEEKDAKNIKKNSKSTTSSTEKIDSRQSCDGASSWKRKRNNLESSAKLNNGESSQQMTDDETELPKKRAKVPAKKLMKKNEALKKTKKFNEKKKALSSGNVTVSSKTASHSLDLPVLPRRVTRFASKTDDNSVIGNSSKLASSKTKNKSSNENTPKTDSFKTKNNSTIGKTIKLDVSRRTPGVKFSSKTPETIPRRKNDSDSDLDPNCSPFILLDRLDTSTVSTYAITPLREDRGALPSKSVEDYGIDDVNTDDSTDEEDHPKKIVPSWATSLGHKPEVQFYFPREQILQWIRPPKRRFTVKSLFF